MDGKSSLKSATERLHDMSRELGRFMADSEGVFVATGATLGQLEEEATRALADSSAATHMGQDGHDPAQALRKGLDELQAYLAQGKTDTDNGLRVLEAVVARVNRLGALDGDFRAIVATLGALASTTHLENSRPGAARAGFASVVSDLRAMSQRIKPKFGEVTDQGNHVRRTAEAALAQGREYLAHHRRDEVAFRKQTDVELAAMAKACTTSLALAGQCTDSMSGVRSSIAEVLQSLQVQDIARQMLEHVVQDLDDFAVGVRAIADADGNPAEQRSWQAELALVSRLAAAQIEGACGRLSDGLVKIERGLQAVASTLAQLAKASARFCGDGSVSIFSQLGRGIRDTDQSLRAHDRQQTAMMGALATVSTTAAGMEKLVDEVASLGEDARFIGLNAMVKAVRVGQAGATLTVLAREIQSASDQIQATTRSAAAIMREVAQAASALVGAPAGEPSRSRRPGEEVAAELEALIRDLADYQTALAKAVQTLVAKSDSIRNQVSGASGPMRRLAERIEDVRKIGRELAALHAVALVAAQGAAPPEGRRHDESLRHTMEDERDIHRAALGVGPRSRDEKESRSADTHSAEGSIEFF